MATRTLVRALGVLVLGSLFAGAMEASVRAVEVASATTRQDPPPASFTTQAGEAIASRQPQVNDGQQREPRGEPVRVVIPEIGVDAVLGPVGRNDDGSMVVPAFGQAGWYSEGPRPGHAGPAAIVAHVDSRRGPDVFARLHELAAGAEIHVVYDSGDTVTFLAAATLQAPKNELPVDAIWPVTRQRMLALITCGGDFDRTVGHYRDNVIVLTG